MKNDTGFVFALYEKDYILALREMFSVARDCGVTNIGSCLEDFYKSQLDNVIKQTKALEEWNGRYKK